MNNREREKRWRRSFVCPYSPSVARLLCRLLFIFPSRIESEKGAYNKNIFTERVVILFSPECGTFFFYISREREIPFYSGIFRESIRLDGIDYLPYTTMIPRLEIWMMKLNFPLLHLCREFLLYWRLPLAINGNREKEKGDQPTVKQSELNVYRSFVVAGTRGTFGSPPPKKKKLLPSNVRYTVLKETRIHKYIVLHRMMWFLYGLSHFPSHFPAPSDTPGQHLNKALTLGCVATKM